LRFGDRDLRLGEDDLRFGDKDFRFGEDDLRLGDRECLFGEDDLRLGDEDDCLSNCFFSLVLILEYASVGLSPKNIFFNSDLELGFLE